MRALATDNHSHPLRPVLIKIEQPGQFSDVRSLPHLAIRVVGGFPDVLGDQAEQLRRVRGQGEPD